MKIIVTIIPANLITNLLLSIARNQKQESNFQEVGDLVTRNKGVALYFKSISEGHYVTKKFFFRFRLLEAIFLFIFVPWNLLIIKIMGVKFFRGEKCKVK